jgi:hypothetical protein
MTVSPSIPATIETSRSRLFGGGLVVAAAAAGITWALLSFAVDTGSTSTRGASPSQAASASLVQQAQAYGRGLTEIGKLGAASASSYANRIAKLTRVQQAAAFGGPGAVLDALGLSAGEKQYVQGITSMSNEQQAAAFGGPGAVLDALGLSAREKQYVLGITSMSTEQQAAAFGR